MFKYLFDYIILLLCFLLIDIFMFTAQSAANVLGYIPTITMVGKNALWLVIPYTYLIVRFIFIRKTDANGNDKEYLNIRNKLINIVTIINIFATLIEIKILNNISIWIIYTILITLFLKFLKTKKEKMSLTANKRIKDYFEKGKL